MTPLCPACIHSIEDAAHQDTIAPLINALVAVDRGGHLHLEVGANTGTTAPVCTRW